VTAHKRPVFLAVSRIHLPVMAVLSLGHRISGVVMVLFVPLLVWLFGRSLADEHGYAEVLALLHGGAGRICLVLLVWVFAHHLLAGIRYLLIDLGIGVGLRHGRASAWAVLGGGVLVMFGAALVLL
jgi:succinate dehydrogenase / fumarate reductase cytochrome b subunit